MRSAHSLMIAFMLLSASIGSPVVARAQDIFSGVSGFLDLNYSSFSSKSKDSTGDTVKFDSNSFHPRFNLTINTTIFPNLRLYANGLFEKEMTVTETDGTKTRTTNTRLTPYINLTFSDKPFTAGVSYSRREETTEVSHTPAFKRVNEEYDGAFGWHPDGLPWLDLILRKTNRFDEKRTVLDTTEDYYGLTLRYLGAVKGLDLRYSASYDDRNDNLLKLEVMTLGQTARATYSNTFFNNRISLNTNYVLNQSSIKTSAEGTGPVSFPVFSFGGLFVVDNTLSPIALLLNAALIDGDLSTSAGVNIGLPPLGGDTRPRQIGLDLFNPTEVNSLLVWVDRELPPGIAGSFLWEVFTSEDNLTWSHWVGPGPASFGPFQNRFEINFPNVVPPKRYIKVVTNPLNGAVPGAAAFPNIFITEIQAFNNKPASEVRGRTTSTTHFFNLDARTRIFNIPYLYHTVSFFYKREEPSGQQNYDLVNSLNVSQRFSRIFSGSGRAAIENAQQGEKTTVSYLYDASITAEPVRTLRHNLLYSGRIDQTEGKTGNFNSIFLNNNAELYKGIDVYLNGGYSWRKGEEGQSTTSETISFGSTIVPHPTMNINVNYTTTMTDQSGGGQPGSSTSTSLGDLTLTYTPLPNLRFFAEFGIISGTNQKTDFTQNYGINWTPFPDGALQFNFNYNENTRSVDNSKERIINPSVRWRLGSRSYLDVSYQWTTSDSNSQSTKAMYFNTTLKIFF